MTASEAIRIVLSGLTHELVVAANGYISRQTCNQRDRAENFYMLGSMGLASSIALGAAIARPERKVVVVDGDGNILMALGVLAMIGNIKPRNLIHIVIDNEQYASTGGQCSVSSTVSMADLAIAAGYRKATTLIHAAEVSTASESFCREDGPAFLLLKVSADLTPAPRVPHSPTSIAQRFRECLLSSGSGRTGG